MLLEVLALLHIRLLASPSHTREKVLVFSELLKAYYAQLLLFSHDQLRLAPLLLQWCPPAAVPRGRADAPAEARPGDGKRRRRRLARQRRRAKSKKEKVDAEAAEEEMEVEPQIVRCPDLPPVRADAAPDAPLRLLHICDGQRVTGVPCAIGVRYADVLESYLAACDTPVVDRADFFLMDVPEDGEVKLVARHEVVSLAAGSDHLSLQRLEALS